MVHSVLVVSVFQGTSGSTLSSWSDWSRQLLCLSELLLVPPKLVDSVTHRFILGLIRALVPWAQWFSLLILPYTPPGNLKVTAIEILSRTSWYQECVPCFS